MSKLNSKSFRLLKVFLNAYPTSNKNTLSRLIATTSWQTHQQANKKSAEEEANNSFLNSSSVTFIEEIYKDWLSDTNQVDKSWDIFFTNNNLTAIKPNANSSDRPLHPTPRIPLDKLIQDHLKLYALIRSYQIRGHRKATLDPLGRSLDVTNERIIDLTPEFYKFTQEDLNREFRLPSTTFIGGGQHKLTLKEILKRLNDVYCKNMGLEYMYINSTEKCDWIRQQFETPGVGVLNAWEKKLVLKGLIKATRLEEFFSKKWGSEKRFGLDGCEVLIPAMKQLLNVLSTKGTEKVIMGMPHRGRLNVRLYLNLCSTPRNL
jgi:2-oxoglutarate dehydrogenase E1 component